MTRVNRLKGVTFTQPNLPIVQSFGDIIRGLPSLEAWFNGNSQSVLRDGDNKVTKWLERTDKGTFFSRTGLHVDTVAPIYMTGGYKSLPYVKFISSATAPSRLGYSGLLGPGTAGTRKQTKIVIGALYDGVAGSVQQLLSDTTPGTGWNAMYFNPTSNGGTGQIQQVLGAAGNSTRAVVLPAGVKNSGVPVCMITSLDDTSNLNKLRIAGTPGASNDVADPNVNVEANNGFIGSTGPLGNPGGSSESGIQMDLYEMIILGDDLLAPANAAQLAKFVEAVGNVYQIAA